MHAPKAEQGPQPSATLPVYHPTQQIAARFPLPPQNFSAPQQYVRPPPLPYPQQGGPLRPTEWSSSLCACCADPCVCYLTFWCPCITFGQIAELVDEGSPPCCVSGGIYCVLLYLTGLTFCYSSFYRTKMRAKFNLGDIPCNDCLVHCCCEPCALCQEYRELKHRGYHPARGWERNLQRQQAEWGLPWQHLRIQPWQDDPTSRRLCSCIS